MVHQLIDHFRQVSSERGIVGLKPRSRSFSNCLFCFGWKPDDFFDARFELIFADVKVCAEVSRFAGVIRNGVSSPVDNQFVHRWRVCREGQSAAAHCFDDIVPPSLREGRAEMDAVFVEQLL